MVGDSGEQVGGAVSARFEGELGGGVGAAFLGEESFVLGVVGDVGGDGFKEPVAEAAQFAGPEPGGLFDQVRLTVEPQLGVEVGGEVVEGGEDDVGLGELTRPSSSAAPTWR